VALSSLDLFIVNVALPSMARSFPGATLSDLSWILNAYAIVFAALLVPAGRLADRAGRRGGFLIGVAIFTVSSALCAASGSLAVLIGFRMAQALGAALLVPTSLGLVLNAYPPERRGGAVRTWAAMGGLAAAVGPVAGGLLVSASWRWVFLVNVPVGIVAIVAGGSVLDKTPGEGGPLPDLVGAAVLTGGIGAVTLGLVEANTWGWGSGGLIGSLLAGAVLLAGFAWRCERHSSPVIELELLRQQSFALTTLAAVLFSAAFGAMLLSVVLFAQDDWGWSALETGLSVAPGPLMVPVFSLVAGRLIPRVGPGGTIAIGCSVFAGGVAWWHTSIGLHPDYAGSVLGGMLFTGIGVGLTLPTLFSNAAASLHRARFATGAAVVSMARQIGIVVGVATFIAVVGTSDTARGRLADFERGWVLVAVLALSGAAAALFLYRVGPAHSPVAAPLAATGATVPVTDADSLARSPGEARP
jgi:EmrB/QacA subfamily drug resistance transporter